jgi:hypothetical protein
MEKLRIRIIRSYYKDANLFWTVITPRHLKLIGSIKDTGEENVYFMETISLNIYQIFKKNDKHN